MTAVHAARLADVEIGGTAIVNGVGGVGLMVIQVLALPACARSRVADSQDKAKLATAGGAADVIVARRRRRV